jgi:hypothetical protein
MLKAILHGKAGRIEHNKDDSVSWSSLFKAREDLLTSTVFERFYYLSDTIQQRMLQHWFKAYSGSIPTDFGELEDISYWPRFTHEHDKGSNQVEPDLILNFAECNIIVEVKPPAGGEQYFHQWQKEIASFLQSEEYQSKPLYFLAIGRISVFDVKQWAAGLLKQYEELNGIAALEWAVVTEHILTLTTDTVLTKQDGRILNDILEGLSLYGLQTSPFKWPDLAQYNGFLPLSLTETYITSYLKKQIFSNPENMNELFNHSFRTLNLQHFQSCLKE